MLCSFVCCCWCLPGGAQRTAEACGSGAALDSYVETPEAPFAVALVLVVLASFGVLLVVAVELCVLYSLSRAAAAGASPPRRRSLWLGQLLLAALALCYLTLFAFAVRPSAASCAVQRFAVGACYALVFAALLVKALLLLAQHRSETAGAAGGLLTLAQQVLVVLLLWLVQLVADAEWLALSAGGSSFRPAQLATLNASAAGGSGPGRDGGPARSGGSGGAAAAVTLTYCRCAGWYFSGAFYDQLGSLAYVALQLAALLALSVRVYKVRGNHREGKWIAVSAVACATVWLTWITVGCLLVRDKEAAVPFGLWATATVVLTTVYVPKLHWLARAERNGKEAITLEDSFSDLASNATLPAYSPDYAHSKYEPPTPSPTAGRFARRSCTPLQYADEGRHPAGGAGRSAIYEEVLTTDAAYTRGARDARMASDGTGRRKAHARLETTLTPPDVADVDRAHYGGDPDALELRHPGSRASTTQLLNASPERRRATPQECTHRKYICRTQGSYAKRATRSHVHRRAIPSRPASLPGDLHRIGRRCHYERPTLSRPRSKSSSRITRRGVAPANQDYVTGVVHYSTRSL